MRVAASAIAPDLRSLFVVLSICNFAIGMGAFSIVGMIEPLADGLGVSEAEAGSLLSVYALGFAASSPVLVSMTGRVGRRRVLAIGLLLFAAASLLTALAPGIGWIYPMRILAAAGAGMVTPVTLAIAAALAPEDVRGRALSLVFLGITISQVVGVPVGGWLAYTFGWRVVFVLVAALLLPCIWLVWTRVPAGLRFEPVSLGDLGRALRNRAAVLAVSFTVVFLSAFYVLFTYLPPLLSQTMGFGRDGIALALFLFGLPAPLGNLLGGRLSDAVGPVRALVIVCLVCIPLLAAFGTFPVPLGVAFALIALWSLVAWMMSPPQQARLVAVDLRLAPVLLSLHAASIYVGIAVGAWLGGLVLNSGGVTALGPAAGVLSFAALCVLLWSHRVAQMQAR